MACEGALVVVLVFLYFSHSLAEAENGEDVWCWVCYRANSVVIAS